MGRDNFTIKTTNVVLPGRSFASNLQKKHSIFIPFLWNFLMIIRQGHLLNLIEGKA